MNPFQRSRTITLPVPFDIPIISDALLTQLAATIRPVVDHDGKLFYIEPVDPRRSAFTWDPTIAHEAPPLHTVAIIKTLHTYGAPIFFKPTIAEVLAQIPAAYIDRITAFKTDCNPEGTELWTEEEHVALEGGFHLATTTLYAPR